MKYLWQPQWLIYSITVSVLILIVGFGAFSIWPPSWRRKLHDAAIAEVKRRSEVRDTFSQSELAAIDRLLGDAPKDIPPSAEDDQALLNAISTLVGQGESDAILAEVTEYRTSLENAALHRQVTAVEITGDIKKAARLWQFCIFLNACIFVISGVKWFFPRSVAHLKLLYAKYITNVSIVGAVIGIFVAYLKERPFDTDVSNFISIVGNALSISFITALILSTAQLFHSVFIVTSKLDPQQYLRNIVFTASRMLFILSAIIFVISGEFSEICSTINLKIQIYLTHNLNTAQLGTTLMAILFLVAMWNALKHAGMRELNASSRLYYLAAIPFVFTLLLTMASAFLPASPSTSLFWIKVSALTCVIILTVGALLHLKEWVLEYRYLLTHKLKVKNFGFRWWALAAWIVGSVAAAELENILAISELAAYNYSIFRCVLVIYVALTLILALSFIPGLIITGLFFRRVHKAYNDVTYSQASKHPLSDQSTNS